jgi:phosphodiesterase/alkaline phosphatase D-like protein
LLLWFSSVSYATRIIDESFEGTGYQLSGYWSEQIGSGNSLDKNYPIEEDTNGAMPSGAGTECLRLYNPGTTTDNKASTTGTTNYSVGVGRWFIKVNSFSFSSPASGDYAPIASLYDGSALVSSRVLIYYNGTNYDFRLRYYSGSLKTDTQGYVFSFNTWYRHEMKLDYTNKVLYYKIYDLSGTELFSRTISLSNPRYVAQIHCSIANNPAKTLTAEILFDLVVLDDDTFPIGTESEPTSVGIMTLRPNGAGTYSEFSKYPNSGEANWQDVDETTPDDDTTYVYATAPTVLKRDTYAFQDPTNFYNKKILGIRVYARARQSGSPQNFVHDVDGESLKFNAIISGTLYASFTDDELEFKPGYEYQEFKWEMTKSIATGKPWTWNEIMSAEFGPRIAAYEVGGTIRVTQVYVEVITGSYNHRYPISCPVFGGITNNKIKVFTKSSRPVYVGNKNSYVKVRYSEYSDLSNYTDTSAVQVSSSTDWTNIFSITGLEPNKTYYFDVLVSPDGSSNWVSLHDLFSMSYYPSSKTAPTPDTDVDFNVFVYNDPHNTSGFCLNSALSSSPAFIINEGDIVNNVNSTSYDLTLKRARRGYEHLWACSQKLIENFWHKMPVFRVWDDHDYYANDADKTATYKDASKQAFKEYMPHPDFPTENSDGQYGIWTKFKWGNAEFFLWDLRYRRDPDGTAHGDMMDGTGNGAGSGSGHDQRDYMISAINNSTAKWKIVLSSVPWNIDESHGGEAWGDYDTYDDQINYLRNNITASNVIFITGDKHACGIDNGTHSKFPEMMVAPAGPASGATPTASAWSEGIRYQGASPYGPYYGVIEVRSNYVTLKVYHEDGTLQLSYQVNVSGAITAEVTFGSTLSDTDIGYMSANVALGADSVSSSILTGNLTTYSDLSLPLSTTISLLGGQVAESALSLSSTINYITDRNLYLYSILNLPVTVSSTGLGALISYPVLSLSSDVLSSGSAALVTSSFLSFSSSIVSTLDRFWITASSLSLPIVSSISNSGVYTGNPLLSFDITSSFIGDRFLLRYSDLTFSSSISSSGSSMLTSSALLNLPISSLYQTNFIGNLIEALLSLTSNSDITIYRYLYVYPVISYTSSASVSGTSTINTLSSLILQLSLQSLSTALADFQASLLFQMIAYDIENIPITFKPFWLMPQEVL